MFRQSVSMKYAKLLRVNVLNMNATNDIPAQIVVIVSCPS